MTSTIQAAIFDLDGVLVDTARFHYLAWRRLAAELGFDFNELDNERLKGVSRMDSLDILLSVGGLAHRFAPAEKERLAARKNDWYVASITQLTPQDMLPGARTFLQTVHMDGIPLGLGSASRNASLILNRLKITELFQAVVDGTMVSHTKPDPEVFIKCADLLGVSAYNQCVVFEDAIAGIEAAKRAEMRTVGVGQGDILRPTDVEIILSDFTGVSWPEIKKQLQGNE